MWNLGDLRTSKERGWGLYLGWREREVPGVRPAGSSVQSRPEPVGGHPSLSSSRGGLGCSGRVPGPACNPDGRKPRASGRRGRRVHNVSIESARKLGLWSQKDRVRPSSVTCGKGRQKASGEESGFSSENNGVILRNKFSPVKQMANWANDNCRYIRKTLGSVHSVACVNVTTTLWSRRITERPFGPAACRSRANDGETGWEEMQFIHNAGIPRGWRSVVAKATFPFLERSGDYGYTRRRTKERSQSVWLLGAEVWHDCSWGPLCSELVILDLVIGVTHGVWWKIAIQNFSLLADVRMSQGWISAFQVTVLVINQVKEVSLYPPENS